MKFVFNWVVVRWIAYCAAFCVHIFTFALYPALLVLIIMVLQYQLDWYIKEGKR